MKPPASRRMQSPQCLQDGCNLQDSFCPSLNRQRPLPPPAPWTLPTSCKPSLPLREGAGTAPPAPPAGDFRPCPLGARSLGSIGLPSLPSPGTQGLFRGSGGVWGRGGGPHLFHPAREPGRHSGKLCDCAGGPPCCPSPSPAHRALPGPPGAPHTRWAVGLTHGPVASPACAAGHLLPALQADPRAR